jgi:hypothetical protein
LDYLNDNIIEATTDIRVCDPGVSTPYQTPDGQSLETLGEIILGKFADVQAWPEMSGATFKVIHNSAIALSKPDSGRRGIFKGSSRNLFEVGTARGGCLHGEGESKVEGTYQLQADGKIIPLEVLNSGDYAVLGRVGRELYQSVGTWQARLVWRPDLNPSTLSGSASLKGTFRGLHYPDRKRVSPQSATK